MDALLILTSLTAVLLAGLLVSLLSKHYRMPNVLLLLILGFLLGKIELDGVPIFLFSDTLLVGLSILSLVVIVFSGSSKFEFKALDASTFSVLRLVLLFLLFNLIFVTLATNLLFFSTTTITTILLSMIYAGLMGGTDVATVLSVFKDKTNSVLDFLKLEAIFNTPLTVLIPFIILEMIISFGIDSNGSVIATFVRQANPFLLNILVGLGAGVLVGLVVIRLMRKFYSASLSPTALLTGALLSYVLAENLAGNGVIAVATFGVFFANLTVKRKEELQEFNFMLSGILEILVFVMVGMIININLNPEFLLKALGLFILAILIRAVALHISLAEKEFNTKERFFMAMNMPKGLAVAVVILTLSVTVIAGGTLSANPELTSGLQQMVDLTVITMIYSLIVSSIMSVFSKRFIRIKLE